MLRKCFRKHGNKGILWKVSQSTMVWAVKEICIAAQLFGSLWLWNSVSEIFMEIVKLFPISIAVPKDYLTSNMQMTEYLKLGETQKAIDTISNYIERMDDQFSQFLTNINT